MKAITLTKPPARNPSTWQTGPLIEYLQHYTIDVESIFQISRHVAILLLLCSGRRVHDLTLLDISPKFYEANDDCIILWPKFGSKTDTTTYRQAEWRLILKRGNWRSKDTFLKHYFKEVAVRQNIASTSTHNLSRLFSPV